MKCWITNIKSYDWLQDNKFAILKRIDGGTGLNWSLGGGTINADGGLGRMLSDDYAYRYNITAFSEFGITKKQTSLPITLLTFTGICKDDIVELYWSTVSEVNNDYFTVEKSLDGENWEYVDMVLGAGNSNELINYSSEDENYSGILTYYRLKQTDYDGMFVYSPIIAIECENTILEILSLIQNDNQLYVYFNSANEEKYTCLLYNPQGQIVYNKTNNSVEGFNNVTINLYDIEQGVYMLVLHNENEVITKKIILK
jgi:hypothetical protein